VRSAREARGIGLRDLARRIGKSPTLLVMLEKNDPAPSVSEETLRGISDVLELNADHLLTLAGKTPDDVVPEDAVEVSIFRLVKSLPPKKKLGLLQELERDLK
jgi:transcriptional regulator with XRE-family HTH domain